jgi:hypothetical protein
LLARESRIVRNPPGRHAILRRDSCFFISEPFLTLCRQYNNSWQRYGFGLASRTLSNCERVGTAYRARITCSSRPRLVVVVDNHRHTFRNLDAFHLKYGRSSASIRFSSIMYQFDIATCKLDPRALSQFQEQIAGTLMFPPAPSTRKPVSE